MRHGLGYDPLWSTRKMRHLGAWLADGSTHGVRAYPFPPPTPTPLRVRC